MKIGDYVYNVPYKKHGVIVEELVPIIDADERGEVVVERRLMVLYNTGEIHLTGSTYLQSNEEREDDSYT